MDMLVRETSLKLLLTKPKKYDFLLLWGLTNKTVCAIHFLVKRD